MCHLKLRKAEYYEPVRLKKREVRMDCDIRSSRCWYCCTGIPYNDKKKGMIPAWLPVCTAVVLQSGDSSPIPECATCSFGCL